LFFFFLFNLGKENRAKNLGAFFFWLCVQGKDIEFLTAQLDDEESGEGKASNDNAVNDSAYAKRKKRDYDNANEQRKSDKREQMVMFKELMSPESVSVSSESSNNINDSIIEKNRAYAVDKIASASHMDAVTAAERIKSLLLVINDKDVFEAMDPSIQRQIRNKLNTLLLE
jgi:hypothetical protein